MFPSASLVQNYEPMMIITVDGLSINGLVKTESADEIVLVTGPNKQVHVMRDQIDEMHRSTVSIMPAGLDKQLSTQQLSDLLEFLKTRK